MMPPVIDPDLDLARLADAELSTQVATLRHLFGFTQEELGQALGGVSPRTVQRWESAEYKGEPHARNKLAVEALRTIAESLSELFEVDTIKVWVDRPNPALNGERPRDYVRKPGGIYIIAQQLGAVGR